VGRHQISTAMAPEDRWGTLRYVSGNGEVREEKVPVGCTHYERIYDSLVEAIEQGKAKCIQDEEVITVLEILEEATEVAKSYGKR
jgi:glutamate racemase